LKTVGGKFSNTCSAGPVRLPDARPFIAAFALTASTIAQAATITVRPPADGGPALVAVEGELQSSDGDQFQAKTSFLGKAVISLRSDGGSLAAGIQMGESIRLKGFTTIVAGNARCASACALAWLGGVPRLMSAASRIGFHAAYDKRDGQETGVGNAIVGAYLNKIGLSYSAVIYITKAAPDSITWLSVADAGKLGIDVQLLDPARAAAVSALPFPPAPASPRNKAGDDRQKLSATSEPPASELPTPQPAPPGLRAEDIIGYWGVAAYHRVSDRTRAEVAARGQCFHPYVINRSAAGHITMLGHDNPQPQDMMIKIGGGKTYIGPGTAPGGTDDREVVSFDGRVLVLKWTDPLSFYRFGIMVLVRCTS
jgi:hypothetical protein